METFTASARSPCSSILEQSACVERPPVVNALAKQRAMLENFFRACVGLPPENNMLPRVLRASGKDAHALIA